MKNKKLFVASSLLCLIPVLIGIIMYNKLPEQVPNHWNIAGEIDGYTSKFNGIILLPLILFTMDFLTKIYILYDPKKTFENNWILIKYYVFFIPILSTMILTFSILISMGYNLPVNTIVCIFLGITFLLIGNYLPKTKQNYTLGLRLPWTLNDETNWDMTHRFAGKIFVIAGILMIFCTLVLKDGLMLFSVSMSAIILAVVFPAIYSFLLFKKQS